MIPAYPARDNGVKCPFCSTAYPITQKYAPGLHQVKCETCHRSFLLEVEVFLKFWKSYQSHAL